MYNKIRRWAAHTHHFNKTMDYAVFKKQGDTQSALRVFRDWEYNEPYKGAKGYLQALYDKAQEKKFRPIWHKDKRGFTFCRPFYKSCSIFIGKGIFDYE